MKREKIVVLLKDRLIDDLAFLTMEFISFTLEDEFGERLSQGKQIKKRKLEKIQENNEEKYYWFLNRFLGKFKTFDNDFYELIITSNENWNLTNANLIYISHRLLNDHDLQKCSINKGMSGIYHCLDITLIQKK